MSRRLTMLIVTMGVIGAALAAAWARIFYSIIRYGGYLAVEHVAWIRWTEFIFTAALSAGYLIITAIVVIKVLRGK
jgi:hypothetical protein